MDSTAVNRFYRIAFRNERSFWQWTERIVELSTLVRDASLNQQTRAVIFVPQLPTRRARLRAYVSAGACAVALRVADGTLIDRSTVIGLAELPAGLIMLLGSDVDEAEYESWHAWQQGAQRGVCWRDARDGTG